MITNIVISRMRIINTIHQVSSRVFETQTSLVPSGPTNFTDEYADYPCALISYTVNERMNLHTNSWKLSVAEGLCLN